jgi:hypothetical protein
MAITKAVKIPSIQQTPTGGRRGLGQCLQQPLSSKLHLFGAHSRGQEWTCSRKQESVCKRILHKRVSKSLALPRFAPLLCVCVCVCVVAGGRAEGAR